jgi:hypothetical protein
MIRKAEQGRASAAIASIERAIECAIRATLDRYPPRPIDALADAVLERVFVRRGDHPPLGRRVRRFALRVLRGAR